MSPVPWLEQSREMRAVVEDLSFVGQELLGSTHGTRSGFVMRLMSLCQSQNSAPTMSSFIDLHKAAAN